MAMLMLLVVQHLVTLAEPQILGQTSWVAMPSGDRDESILGVYHLYGHSAPVGGILAATV